MNHLSLPLPKFIPRLYGPGNLSNWSGHLAFANDLIADRRPSAIVELGTHFGESYFGMCQSVFENGVDCLCYAVDHWKGEAHAGFFAEDVFEQVRAYNQRWYRAFSYLLRTTFEEALTQFSDGSIDLLHIDGYHTYEAGRHDFDTWYPKVRDGGIILLHDIAVKHADFGIWKLWEEITDQFEHTFEFHHGWGLGVVLKGDLNTGSSNFSDLLFDRDIRVREQIRRHYVSYWSHLEKLLKDDQAEEPGHQEGNTAAAKPFGSGPASSTDFFCQVFWPVDGDYSESNSVRQMLAADQELEQLFSLPAKISGSIRIDLTDRPKLIHVRRIEVVDVATQERIWEGRSESDFVALESTDSIFFQEADGCVVLFLTADPWLMLPGCRYENALEVRISLRAESTFDSLPELLHGHQPDIAGIKNELRAAQASRMLLSSEVSQLATEKAFAVRDKQEEIEHLQKQFATRIDTLKGEIEEYKKQATELTDEANKARELKKLLTEQQDESRSLAGRVRELEEQLTAMTTSRSWRLTKPLRAVFGTDRVPKARV